jgi:hypothetical protein
MTSIYDSPLDGQLSTTSLLLEPVCIRIKYFSNYFDFIAQGMAEHWGCIQMMEV